MRNLFRICPILFVLATGITSAQGFTISASPATATIAAGQTETFTITVLPTDGYDASVFLRVASSTVNSANVRLEPVKLDLPDYGTGATLTVSPTRIDIGTHQIVVEGRNGPITTVDTITLTISPAPGDNQWAVYHVANSALPTPWITAVAFDTSGATWVGTTGGLTRAEPGEAPEPVAGPFATTMIRALAVDSSNALWVLSGANLSRYKNGEWIELPTNHLLYGAITAMTASLDGSIWISTVDNGLLRFRENAWAHYRAGDWGGVLGDRLFDIIASSDGDIWALAPTWMDGSAGVLRFDGNFWTTYGARELGLQERVSLTALAITDSNRIWGRAKGRIINIGGPGTPLPDLILDGDGAMAGSPDGRLWVGSNFPRGQILYAREGATWKQYPLDSSGIGHESFITLMRVHNNGSVWVGTQLGLAVLWPGEPGGESGGGTSGIGVAYPSTSAEQMTIIPNPLGSVGSLSLSTKGGSARITLHDNLGREVATLFDGVLASGRQALPIELSSVPAGAYLLSVAIDGETPSSRMIVVAR